MLYFYLLSALQIVLESVPVSSSAHIILLENFLRHFNYDMTIDFFNNVSAQFSFALWAHLLHGPTAIVLALFFFRRWVGILMHLKRTWRIIIKLGLLVCLADVMTAVCYFYFHVDALSVPLWCGLFITTCLLFSLRWQHNQKNYVLTWYTALILGAVQGLALLPGLSRFAAVFVTSYWLGFSSRKAFELTWLLQWPLIAAAPVRSLYYFALQPCLYSIITLELVFVLLGASVISYILLQCMVFLVRTNRLWWFSLYMIVPLMLSLLMP